MAHVGVEELEDEEILLAEEDEDGFAVVGFVVVGFVVVGFVVVGSAVVGLVVVGSVVVGFVVVGLIVVGGGDELSPHIGSAGSKYFIHTFPVVPATGMHVQVLHSLSHTTPGDTPPHVTGLSLGPRQDIDGSFPIQSASELHSGL